MSGRDVLIGCLPVSMRTLMLVEHLPDLLALGSRPGLVLRRGALGGQAPLLGLAFTTLSGALLTPSAARRRRGAELRHEAAGSGAADEAAQVGHWAAAHTAHLQPAGELVEQSTGRDRRTGRSSRRAARRSSGSICSGKIRSPPSTTAGLAAFAFARRASWLL
jgi:hypothetical protein